MLMALRFEPSRFFLKGKALPLRKNLLGSKRKAINIYFAQYYRPRHFETNCLNEYVIFFESM